MEKKRQIWTLLALSVSLLGLVSTQWVEPPPRYQVKIKQKLIYKETIYAPKRPTISVPRNDILDFFFAEQLQMRLFASIFAVRELIYHRCFYGNQCPDRPLFPCVCLKGGEDGVDLECSNTNLASLALGLRQVRTLVNRLRISNCNMEKIYGGVFKLLSVKKLTIEDTPIKDIR